VKNWDSPRTHEVHLRNGFTETDVTFRGKLAGLNFG
jgi:hypothetical protein